MRAHVVRVGPQGRAIELFTSEPQAMVAVADEVEVLTLDNLAALEARKPQVDAEVIARTQGALIGWQNADEFDTEELQEHGDVLRDATRALLAAVEAAPEDEQRPVEDMTEQECLAELEAAGEEGRACLDCQCETQSPFTGCTLELARAAVRDLRKGHGQAAPEERLSEPVNATANLPYGAMGPRGYCGSIPAPDAKHRFAEWCGENFAAIWYEFSLLRDELGLPQPECDEEASGSAPAPTPDFDAMTPEDLSLEEVQALRDWLDERGRREGYQNRSGRWYVLLRERTSAKKIACVGDQPTEPAALLALCQAVASSKAGA